MARIIGSLTYGPATEEQISRLESIVGCALSDEYKDFLRKHNGGRPEPNTFIFINDYGEEEEDCVECFFPLYGLECGEEDFDADELADWPVQCALQDLERDYMESFEATDESRILPIGTDGSGNYIAIALHGEHAGAIVFYEHELGKVSPLANSLSLFLTDLNEMQSDN